MAFLHKIMKFETESNIKEVIKKKRRYCMIINETTIQQITKCKLQVTLRLSKHMHVVLKVISAPENHLYLYNNPENSHTKQC